MRRILFVVAGLGYLISGLGCSDATPRLAIFHTWERIQGKEAVVTHLVNEGARYYFRSGQYFGSIGGGQWQLVDKPGSVAKLRQRYPVLVGNNGVCLSGGLSKLAQALAERTGVAAAIEPTPLIGKTSERIQVAATEKLTIIVLGFSAGCRDVVSAVESAPSPVELVLIEPTYQSTWGYTKLPDRINQLICFRIRGGGPGSFSGRDYRRADFSNPSTPFENVRLATGSHLLACEDPGLFRRLLAEINARQTSEAFITGLADRSESH